MVALKPLTSFRFAAALAVFISHMPFANIGATKGLYAFWFSRGGVVGVSFFFALSGFILIYTYGSKMKQYDGVKIWNYFIARIGRVVPLHLLLFAIAAGLFMIATRVGLTVYYTPFQWGTAFFNVTLLQAWMPKLSYIFAYNPVAWSISVEMFFYLTFPVLAYVGMKVKSSTSIKKMTIGLGGAWVIAVVFALAIKIPNSPTGKAMPILWNSGIDASSYWFLYINPGTRLFEFACGIVAGLIFLSLKDRKVASDHRIKDRWFTLAELSALAFLGFSIWVAYYLPMQLVFSLAYLPAFILLISVFAWQRGIVSKLASNRPMVFFGEISFAFYMWHDYIWLTVANYKSSQVHPGRTIVFCFVVTTILSALTYFFFETPMRKLIRNWGRRRAERKTGEITIERSKKPQPVAV